MSPGRAVGLSLDAEWRDDFHHCLHVLLTREQTGYYARFGGVGQFARRQFARRRRAGRDANGTPRAVVRGVRAKPRPDRQPAPRRAAGSAWCPSRPANWPPLPCCCRRLSRSLFMGEEYGEETPFLYFISHSNPALSRAVRAGRQVELAEFGWRGRPPDPQATSPSSARSSTAPGRNGHRIACCATSIGSCFGCAELCRPWLLRAGTR